MEIERVNENTIKFYISYVDIEDRGFEREEIWYNRERSEQLFWQMMDEVNYKEDFNVDGPLWIQVQAMKKGLEIMVTKAQMSKNDDNIELPTDEENNDLSIEDKMEDMLEKKFGAHQNKTKENEEVADENLWITTVFNEFEDVIQLSHYLETEDNTINSILYYYDGKYYLYLEFDEDLNDIQENFISRVLEFSSDSDITLSLLDEYGKKVFQGDVFTEIRNHFSA